MFMILVSVMNKSMKLLIIALLLGVIGYFAYNLVLDWHREGVETAKQELREELKLRDRPVVPKEKLIEAFGEEPAEVSPKDRRIGLDEIERQIVAFFSYLDTKEYIKAYELKDGTYHQFLQTVDDLSSNHPVVVGETESLYSLMKNITYLFKVLGVERVNLIKEVLRNESEIIESVMNNFYLWLTMDAGVNERIKGRPSLEVSYEYAAYFLHTIAGKSYLSRRESKVRILTAYYCVLILDRANDLVLNSNGIDIRPHIKSLLTDIQNQRGFINKEKYLFELQELQGKYRL